MTRLLILVLTQVALNGSSAVSICDLVSRSQEFSGKLVTVRGRLEIAFEHFGLSSTQCAGRQVDHIWLEYGSGPKRQPATWCCGDMIPRDPLRVNQNADSRRFHRLLTAQARKKGCYEGECYLYEVTATLSGRFDAVPSEPCPNGRSRCCYGGFGHFGAFCTRLVIASVSDVTYRDVSARHK